MVWQTSIDSKVFNSVLHKPVKYNVKISFQRLKSTLYVTCLIYVLQLLQGRLFGILFNFVFEGKPYSRHLGMGAFFGATFFEKRAFCLLTPTKQMSFLTVSDNLFFKTKGTRLGALERYFNSNICNGFNPDRCLARK